MPQVEPSRSLGRSLDIVSQGAGAVALGKDVAVTSLSLAKPEAMFLAQYLRGLTTWGDSAAVRIQGRGTTYGFFGGPLESVITFIALPAATTHEEFDVVVSAARLRDVIGDVRRLDGPSEFTLPDETGTPQILSVLPPTSGWMPAFSSTAGDIASDLDAQIARVNARVDLLPPERRFDALRDAWQELSWTSMPLAMMHTARSLGFLNLPAAKVAATTNGPWKRVATPAGMVFARVADGLARLSVVRSDD